jgi:glycerol-1-phosphate dehydrogenase [NAD(P)+]
MSFAGNSRPASGSEHHLSHFWEMMFLQENRKCALHGTKVAVGTVLALKLYEDIKEVLIRLEELPAPEFDEEEWNENIRNIYKQSAKQIIELEESVRKNSDSVVLARREAVRFHMDDILTLLGRLPKAEVMIELLQSIGSPYLPEHIQVSDKMVSDSIRYAKELRNRYGVLQMLFDLQ